MAGSVFSSLSLLPSFVLSFFSPIPLITTGLIFLNFVAQRINYKLLHLLLQ